MINLYPELFGPVSRYILLADRGQDISVVSGAPFDKRRKSLHRYTIADVNGRMQLTVPVVKPQSSAAATWDSIRISTHGAWWNVHRTALESAYGRTPFFEFYIDRLAKYFSHDTPERYTSVEQLAMESEKEICAMLHIAPPETVTGARPEEYPAATPITPYWQVRDAALGFTPDLSVLDLLFSLGPEAAVYLRNNFIIS